MQGNKVALIGLEILTKVKTCNFSEFTGPPLHLRVTVVDNLDLAQKLLRDVISYQAAHIK